jgi:hypothetical protein
MSLLLLFFVTFASEHADGRIACTLSGIGMSV